MLSIWFSFGLMLLITGVARGRRRRKLSELCHKGEHKYTEWKVSQGTYGSYWKRKCKHCGDVDYDLISGEKIPKK